MAEILLLTVAGKEFSLRLRYESVELAATAAMKATPPAAGKSSACADAVSDDTDARK